MSARKLGLELELLATRDGVPLGRDDWRAIVACAVARGWEEVAEPYSGFPLGASCARGRFVLDNNCAVVELVTLPHTSLDATLANLEELLAAFSAFAPGVVLNWTSQFAAPSEAEYWARTPPSGLYGIVRKERWKHWTMMNSMAFQPAIDLAPGEIAAVLRVLYLTAPLFIWAYEGNKRWGAEHSPRLALWPGMVPDGEARIGLPQREIASLDDYVDNLLELPAFILSDRYKQGRLTYFGGLGDAPRVAEAMFGEVAGYAIEGLADPADPAAPMLLAGTLVRGTLADFYSLSLPFWHARLVFETQERRLAGCRGEIVAAIENAAKRYVEIRHIGTPRGIAELRAIYTDFLAVVENAAALDAALGAAIGWEAAREECQLAIHAGRLGEQSRAALAILQNYGILQGRTA